MIISSQTMASRGIFGGLAIGLMLGIVGGLASTATPEGRMLGLPPMGFVVASAIIGGTLGGLVGSLAGLPEARTTTVTQPRDL